MPKNTWTPVAVSKPDPTTVTRVPPSLVPPAGRSEEIVGWPEAVAPYAKQVGSDRTVGCAWLVPSESAICAASCGAPNSENPGVKTTIWLAVTDCTTPSLVVPLTVN